MSKLAWFLGGCVTGVAAIATAAVLAEEYNWVGPSVPASRYHNDDDDDDESYTYESCDDEEDGETIVMNEEKPDASGEKQMFEDFFKAYTAYKAEKGENIESPEEFLSKLKGENSDKDEPIIPGVA